MAIFEPTNPEHHHSTRSPNASKAKILAAKRNTSISGVLAEQIETLVGEDDAYEQAQRRALALLDQGCHVGGRIESTRDEWHER